jgi:acetyl/propionyl-CoA carboxylase alpha subunit
MSKNRINKILIANRGEIALRIQRACQKLKIPCAITISDADRETMFAREAAEKALIGGIKPQDSYGNIEKIIGAAKSSGCNAIHPGYGFLSENSEFAKKTVEAGLIFIGPPAEVIRTLGDKLSARAIAKKAAVPISEGTEFPQIIKAAAGGGGRGMRIVRDKEELAKLLPLARAEALKSFGSDQVFTEHYIENPRHVEVQVFGDSFGNVIQKVIEEAPAPSLTDSLRKALQDAAVKIAKEARYQSAGTAEFLVKDGKFYFLEMNTRIQVEHPVTEEISGVDLVEWQIRTANGEKLALKQEDVDFKGHAIEYRIYAEDPAIQFSPAKGEITALNLPANAAARYDFGFAAKDTVTLFYDAMLGKVIIKGNSRADAINKSDQILKKMAIEGVGNNLKFLRWMVRHTSFREAPVDIKFVEREFTVEKLESVDAGDIVDPQWRAPIDDLEFTEICQYGAHKLEILHRSDEVFVATVLGEKRYSCASNGKETAVREALRIAGPIK